jgi:phytol kinase
MTARFTDDLLSLALQGALCLAILAFAEGLRVLACAELEWTRKFVHLAMGLAAATFPWVFGSPWPVLILCATFLALMAWSRSAGFLVAVHGVPRPSAGGLCYPAAVALVFLLAHDRRWVYVPAILVLTVSDALAALVGRAWGRHPYRWTGDEKTVEGSLAFLASAFVCIHAPLVVMSPLATADCALAALAVSACATGIEAVSRHGCDNLTVPLGVCLALLGLGSSGSGS